MTLKAGQSMIDGKDPVDNYFLVTDTKDGGTSLKIAFTPIRVVCQNTLVVGLKQATVSASLSHYAGMNDELSFRLKLLNKLQLAQSRTIDAFNRMAVSVLQPNQVVDIVTSAYPMPNRPRKAEMLDDVDEGQIEELEGLYDEMTNVQDLWLYHCQRAEAFREGAIQLIEKFNDENKHFANTAWAAYNGVVECEDYREGGDSVFISQLWGTRAQTKRRAFNAALQLSEGIG
jgi:hypothetical protein